MQTKARDPNWYYYYWTPALASSGRQVLVASSRGLHLAPKLKWKIINNIDI
jgi:hypothetical protein